jgi:hypothetical protein
MALIPKEACQRKDLFMVITRDFPGGNIIYNGREDNTVYLSQDWTDASKWWFWWCFRIENPPAGEVCFKFTDGEVVGPYGPAISDNGADWYWQRESFAGHSEFRYIFKDGDIKYFAFSLPYTSAEFERFYKGIPGKYAVRRDVFAVSEGGREIPLLCFGNANARECVVFTARHHCCEATASWALEGTVEALLSAHPGLCGRFAFYVLPFIDIDGVEKGDQGKDRRPHDHNRDYTGNPLYNITKAVYKFAGDRRIAAFIDFHSPYKWGGFDNMPHIHLGKPNGFTPPPQDVFCDRLREITAARAGKDTIIYDNLAYRSAYGGPANKPGTPGAKNYFSALPGNILSFTLETPYFGNPEDGYSTRSLREWGKDIAAALDYTMKQEYAEYMRGSED